MKIKTSIENPIERGSNHVVYDVVAAVFLRKDDIIRLFVKKYGLLGGLGGSVGWEGGLRGSAEQLKEHGYVCAAKGVERHVQHKVGR